MGGFKLTTFKLKRHDFGSLDHHRSRVDVELLANWNETYVKEAELKQAGGSKMNMASSVDSHEHKSHHSRQICNKYK